MKNHSLVMTLTNNMQTSAARCGSAQLAATRYDICSTLRGHTARRYAVRPVSYTHLTLPTNREV
eukprot:1297369-Heterocapsa_arctica.AAC.1